MKLLLICAIAMGLLAPAAHATFGESKDSIDRDMTALNGKKRETLQRPKYSIEKITTPSGVVNEYVSTDGTVFAVTWRGSSHPDLAPLMGNYFDEYRTGCAQHHQKHKHRRVKFKTAHMQFERGGHMRSVTGRVFSAALLPQGVSANEIN